MPSSFLVLATWRIRALLESVWIGSSHVNIQQRQRKNWQVLPTAHRPRKYSMSINKNEASAIVDGKHGQPFRFLGPHVDGTTPCIRAYHPDATACWIVSKDGSHVIADAALVDEHGLFDKYEIMPSNGNLAMLKADPYAFYTEQPPKSASRVFDVTTHRWNDNAWMEARAKSDPLARPMSIYEVHPLRWHPRRCRCLDALPRLFPHRRRLDPQPIRRTREPRSRRIPQAPQPTHPPELPRCCIDRGRIHSLGWCLATDLPRRFGLHLQVEHGLDARRARLHVQGPRPPKVPRQRIHLQHALRLLRELRPRAVPRRSGVRQRFVASKACATSHRCRERDIGLVYRRVDGI